MDVKTDKHIDAQDSCKQPFNCLKDLQPLYQFYKNGISEEKNNKLSSFWDFLKNRTSGELVAGVAIICLSGIAKEFISNRNDGFDSFAFIGFLITVLLIFVLALIALLRATKFNHAKNTKEKQSEKTQLRVSSERTNEDGIAPG
jgi:hypothetical protein